MNNSTGISLVLECDMCGQKYEFANWWLVDVYERPDLLRKVKAATLHEAECPHCGYVLHLNSHLLLYRPKNNPVLLFSAGSLDMSASRNALKTLIGHLKRKLGKEWQDAWVADGVTGVKREHLASILNGGDKALVGQAVPNEKPLRLFQMLIDAEQWSGTKSFVMSNPSVLEPETQQLFEKAVAHSEASGDNRARAMFDEYRQLLRRCVEIGVEAAFEEKTRSDSAI